MEDETGGLESLFDYEPILDFIGKFGVYGVLAVIIILLVHDPSRAEKLKLLFFTPCYKLWKFGSRQYLASKIGLSVTEFFARNLPGALDRFGNGKIKIQWVKDSSDSILKQDGTIILRVFETNDQTQNILAATQVSLGLTVCPNLRGKIEEPMEKAIDLALLHRLTKKLGRYAEPVYAKNFLQPAIRDDEECAALLENLVELDSAGVFTSIFLEELALLGDRLFQTQEVLNQSEVVREFLTYLLTLARREHGEKIGDKLDHPGPGIRTGVVLLAKSIRAEKEGVTPYIRRINQKIQYGFDSVYLLAYKPAFDFRRDILRALEGDLRILTAKENIVETERVCRDTGRAFIDKISVTALRINRLAADSAFTDRVVELGIEVGSLVEGFPIDIAEEISLVDVKGINGTITRAETSWSSVDSCEELLEKHSSREFLVIGIDENKSLLGLSLRFPEDDPFQINEVPNCGEVVNCEIVRTGTEGLTGRCDSGLEVFISSKEVTWDSEFPRDLDEFLGKSINVEVIESSVEERILRGSIRALTENPWPTLHKRFPKGKRLRGKVIEVNPHQHFVRVEIEDGVSGLIPKERMAEAGFEFADFEETVVVGQMLDVVVTKVFINKRKIRLDLQRNLEK